MNTILKQLFPVMACMLLLASCASVQPTAQRADDIYYMPAQASAEQPMAKEAAPAELTEQAAANDDYYDAGTAQQYSGSGNYYDMAYNDPYYYSYGRFGFGVGMGWQSGWNGQGWGMGMNWGYGSGVYSGWYRPSYWDLYGMYNWNSYGPGGYNPWAWYNDPYYNNGSGNYGNNYGYGNYWGPWGNCGCGYSPIIVGGSSNVLVGHRPSLNGNSTADNGVYQTRSMYRDPIALSGSTPQRDVRLERPLSGRTQRPISTDIQPEAPHREVRPIVQPNTERGVQHRAPSDRRNGTERSPSFGGGSNRSGGDRSGGDRAAPSRSDGGGSRSNDTHRSR